MLMKASELKDGQFVVDPQGKRLGVLLDLETYERLREAEEDLADIRATTTPRPRREVRSGPDSFRR